MLFEKGKYVQIHKMVTRAQINETINRWKHRRQLEGKKF